MDAEGAADDAADTADNLTSSTPLPGVSDDSWAPTARGCVRRLEYHPSPWELHWRTRITKHPDASPTWSTWCPVLKNETALVVEWEALWKARAALNGPHNASAWNRSVFSYHTVVDVCEENDGAARRVVRATIPIEPLVSFLRHPRHTCFNKVTYKYNRGYLVPLISWEHPPPRRAFFFDLGASLFSSGTGGASQDWFLRTYRARGVAFDRILAWEAKEYPVNFLLSSFPPGVMDVLSYYNMPVSAAANHRFNPWRTLRAIASPHDLVVVKLDVDNSTVENALVAQLLADSTLAGLIDEFYYEHHVLDSPMFHQGWRRQGVPDMNLAESYGIFTSLRQMGIRAHSWV